LRLDLLLLGSLKKANLPRPFCFLGIPQASLNQSMAPDDLLPFMELVQKITLWSVD
jgi:hypothetical protein